MTIAECSTMNHSVISITDGVLMCVNVSFVKMACRSWSGVSRHLRGPGVFRWWRGTAEAKAAAAPHPEPRTWWWVLVAGQWSSNVSPPQRRCGFSQHVSQEPSKDKNTLYYIPNNDFFFFLSHLLVPWVLKLEPHHRAYKVTSSWDLWAWADFRHLPLASFTTPPQFPAEPWL